MSNIEQNEAKMSKNKSSKNEHDWKVLYEDANDQNDLSGLHHMDSYCMARKLDGANLKATVWSRL